EGAEVAAGVIDPRRPEGREGGAHTPLDAQRSLCGVPEVQLAGDPLRLAEEGVGLVVVGAQRAQERDAPGRTLIAECEIPREPGAVRAGERERAQVDVEEDAF